MVIALPMKRDQISTFTYHTSYPIVTRWLRIGSSTRVMFIFFLLLLSSCMTILNLYFLLGFTSPHHSFMSLLVTPYQTCSPLKYLACHFSTRPHLLFFLISYMLFILPCFDFQHFLLFGDIFFLFRFPLWWKFVFWYTHSYLSPIVYM